MNIRGPMISPMLPDRPRAPLPVYIIVAVLCVLLLVAACLLLVRPAYAHDAPAGWSYPFSCCSNFDCRQVSSKAIGERPTGYVIKNTGEVLTYGDSRLKDSPDGEYHWCSVAGEANSRTICLFVPPKGF